MASNARSNDIYECRDEAVILNARWRGSTPAEGQVYVGRPSKWGNPFIMGRDGTRAEVIEKYRRWIAGQPDLLRDLHELRGKDLVCWCAPKACHAEVLQELVNRCFANDARDEPK